MKKLRELTVLAGMLTCCAAMGAEAEIPKCDFAVEVSGATEAILAACELVTTAQDQGYGFLRAEPCMYGKHLRDEENTEVRCHFEKGQVIRVLASGCLLAEDIDLRVFRPDGWRIADDTKFHKAASVDFTTTVSGDYRLSMELARTSKSAFCLMVVMEQGGHQVATDDLSQLFVRYLAGNALIARNESQKGRSLTYARTVRDRGVLIVGRRRIRPSDFGAASHPRSSRTDDTSGCEVNRQNSSPLFAGPADCRNAESTTAGVANKRRRNRRSASSILRIANRRKRLQPTRLSCRQPPKLA